MIKTTKYAFFGVSFYLSLKHFNCEESSVEVIQANSKSAISILIPHNKSEVKGLVSFHQKNFSSPIQIVANIIGLNPNSSHGLNIHEFGDLTNSYLTTGPHFNPDHQKHGGSLDKERHVGDLGNIKTDERGNGYLATEDERISLFGANSVLGRSVVVHQLEDDLGRGDGEESTISGNSGTALACGIIGLCDKFKNMPPS